MSRLVPVAIRDRVVATIAAEAAASGWEHLVQSDKTAFLSRWVNAEEVGGLLRPLLGSDAEVRVWITDVALKRRARTLLPAAESVARAVLGNESAIRPGSAGMKPAHCVATIDGQAWFVCWDRASNVRHLFWAAICARADMKDIEGAIVGVIEPMASATERSARTRLERIAASCGVEIRWLEL